MFKKLFCICLVLSISLGVSAAEFNDTEGHWAEKTIDKWSDMGVITGYEGSFEPDMPIKRGDFALIIEQLMRYTEISINTFSDLDKDTYYTEMILKLNKMRVMLGCNGKISPEEYLTREEAFVMLNRVYDIKGEEKAFTFNDASEISDWALDAVKVMYGAGIINGNENNMVRPKDNATRAEIIQLFDNIGNIKNENNTLLIPDYVSDFSIVDKELVDAGKIQW